MGQANHHSALLTCASVHRCKCVFEKTPYNELIKAAEWICCPEISLTQSKLFSNAALLSPL